VPGSPPYDALLVPDAAVGTEQTRKFLFVVGADNKVQQKYVELGQATKDNLRVIKSGIGPDDRIIVNGLMRARAGIVVSPKMEGEAAPNSEPKPPAAPAKK
jgi:multidrug efflux pump subunit AcrA (membrane-fusion protein)